LVAREPAGGPVAAVWHAVTGAVCADWVWIRPCPATPAGHGRCLFVGC
jgi:hypothetical protein